MATSRKARAMVPVATAALVTVWRRWSCRSVRGSENLDGPLCLADRHGRIGAQHPRLLALVHPGGVPPGTQLLHVLERQTLRHPRVERHPAQPHLLLGAVGLRQQRHRLRLSLHLPHPDERAPQRLAEQTVIPLHALDRAGQLPLDLVALESRDDREGEQGQGEGDLPGEVHAAFHTSRPPRPVQPVHWRGAECPVGRNVPSAPRGGALQAVEGTPGASRAVSSHGTVPVPPPGEAMKTVRLAALLVSGGLCSATSASAQAPTPPESAPVPLLLRPPRPPRTMGTSSGSTACSTRASWPPRGRWTSSGASPTRWPSLPLEQPRPLRRSGQGPLYLPGRAVARRLLAQ